MMHNNEIDVDTLRDEIRIVTDDLPALRRDALSQDLAKHFVARLKVATENATGCALLAEHGLGLPLITITRSIFEGMIATYWASLSEENGKIILASASNEGVRLLRNLLQTSSVGRVQHKVTGEDVTKEILAHPHMASAKKPPGFKDMAESSGIGKLYVTFYGVFSMFSHGTATDWLDTLPRQPMVAAHASTARVLLRALHLIVTTHIREHRAVTLVELNALLKLPFLD